MNDVIKKNTVQCRQFPEGIFSVRVRYAVQLLADLEVIGCCNLGALAECYRSELSFDRMLVKQVAARLTLWGILRYEPGLKTEDLNLTVSPEQISVFALVSAVSRKIDILDFSSRDIPQPDGSLKEITVRKLIDTCCMVGDTTIRQDTSGRIRLALERDRKDTRGEFMPVSHEITAGILDDRNRCVVFGQRRIDRLREVMESIETDGKDL